MDTLTEDAHIEDGRDLRHQDGQPRTDAPKRVTPLKAELYRLSADILPYETVFWHRTNERERVLRASAAAQWSPAVFAFFYSIISLTFLYIAQFDSRGAFIMLACTFPLTYVGHRACRRTKVAEWYARLETDERYLWQEAPYDSYLADMPALPAVPSEAKDLVDEIRFRLPPVQATVEFFGKDPLLRLDLGSEQYYVWAW